MSAGAVSAPRNFPFDWPDPADAERYWITDLQHNAYPRTPLAGGLADAFPRGMGKAFAGAPPPPPRRLVLNGYVYTEVRPRPPGPPPALVDHDPSLRPAENWQQRILPRVRAITDPLTAFPIDDVTLPELRAHLLALHEDLERLGTLHHQAVMPGGMAQGGFRALCATAGATQAELAAMLCGVETLSLLSSQDQWELGRSAAGDALLEAVLAESRPAEIEEKLRALGATAAALLAGVEAHCAVYGWRPASLHPYTLPVREDRTPVWEAIRAAAAGGLPSPRERHAAVARERAATVERVRGRLPEDRRLEFDRLYAAALDGVQVIDDHNVLIDQVAMALVHRAADRLARRLHAVRLVAGERDGYFLELAELAALDLERPDQTLIERLTERRQQWERCCTYAPPVAIGTRPAEVDEFSDQFIGRTYEPGENPRVLRGTGGSAGTATGTARVLRDMSEADRLGAGDILVCITTLPPWTPLFARAGGIVTVGGGVLAHAAITAREFGIPAVLSVADATTLIRDGQRVTVDGTNGIVRLED